MELPVDDKLAGGLIITALLLAVGHWFPWPQKLHRVAAYTYGLLSILAGMAFWLGTQHLWPLWWGLCGFAVVAGLTVCGAYALDWTLNARLRRQHDQ
jgi:hypothetical protein